MRQMSLIIFLVLVYPISGYAEGWTSQGARILEVRRNAIEVGFGYPGLKFAFHMPIQSQLQVSPFFTFHYGTGTQVPVVGDALGAQIKYNLFRSGGLDFAIQSETGFFIIYHPIVLFGLQLGFPEMILSYTSGQFSAFGGIKIPFGFSFYNNIEDATKFIVIIPITFNLGAEFSITPSTNIFFTMDMGARILAAKGGSSTHFNPSVLFGLASKF